MIEKILNKIDEYECICLYRHVNPDYDAFGSQFGMYDLIQNTFENKEVYFAGDFSSDLVAKYQFNGEINEPNFEKPTLGIVLDTANQERIDGDISLCKEIIKIDHHIVVDSYGNLNLEDSTASSCSQIVALFLKNKRVKLSSFGAAALYMGIIGDTNRFMYSATDERTFEAAMYLYNYDFDMQALYERMYMKHVKDLKVNAFILNHYIEDEGVAYYVLKDEDLKIFEEFFDNTRIILSTNLLSKLTPYKIKLMKKVEDVNTSWNPKRFTSEQYQYWLKQLKILNDNNISYSVMITLTKDLIQMNPLDFYNLVCSWEKCRNIDLKQMIGDLDYMIFGNSKSH